MFTVHILFTQLFYCWIFLSVLSSLRLYLWSSHNGNLPIWKSTAMSATKQPPLSFYSVFGAKKFRTFLVLIIVMVLIFIVTVRHDFEKITKNRINSLNYRVRQRQETVEKGRKDSEERTGSNRSDNRLKSSLLNDKLSVRQSGEGSEPRSDKKPIQDASMQSYGLMSSREKLVQNGRSSLSKEKYGEINPLEARKRKENVSTPLKGGNEKLQVNVLMPNAAQSMHVPDNSRTGVQSPAILANNFSQSANSSRAAYVAPMAVQKTVPDDANSLRVQSDLKRMNEPLASNQNINRNISQPSAFDSVARPINVNKAETNGLRPITQHIISANGNSFANDPSRNSVISPNASQNVSSANIESLGGPRKASPSPSAVIQDPLPPNKSIRMEDVVSSQRNPNALPNDDKLQRKMNAENL